MAVVDTEAIIQAALALVDAQGDVERYEEQYARCTRHDAVGTGASAAHLALSDARRRLQLRFRELQCAVEDSYRRVA